MNWQLISTVIFSCNTLKLLFKLFKSNTYQFETFAKLVIRNIERSEMEESNLLFIKILRYTQNDE